MPKKIPENKEYWKKLLDVSISIIWFLQENLDKYTEIKETAKEELKKLEEQE